MGQDSVEELIAEAARRIVEILHPRKVVLFGSRARGEARPNSDIDLLVIAESSEPRYRRAIPLYGALSDIPIAMDILVYTPEEVEEWSGVRQAFVTTALREGIVLYEDRG
ncbi:MAG: nucleotidyltransferase domain-containing protein [Thermoflexales bacterium]|nr:nucleotidyltransferase domain-containing protein [Thermoflexales bacterium]